MPNKIQAPMSVEISVSDPFAAKRVYNIPNGPESTFGDDSDKRKLGMCCGIFMLILLSVLPITVLAYAGTYRHNVMCNPVTINVTNSITNVTTQVMYDSEPRLGSTIGIETWLIVEGVTQLIFAIVVATLVAAMCSNMDITICASGCVSMLISVFNLAWTITGSVMFWRDCPNTTPSNINTFMWIILIIELIIVAPLAFIIVGLGGFKK